MGFIDSVKDAMKINTGNIAPVSYKNGVAKIMQPFPVYLDGSSHTGNDFYAREGYQYISVTNGIVTEYVKDKNTGINRLCIKCNKTGLSVIYKHANSILNVNDIVKENDIIAVTDNSGHDILRYTKNGIRYYYWNGFHLHFQIWDGNKNIDPITYLLEVQPNLIYEFANNDLLNFYKQKPYFAHMSIVA